MFLVELLLVVGGWVIAPERAAGDRGADPAGRPVTNTAALGLVLYTRYVYYFQAAGLVLLVAMIGAIVLTLRHKPSVKRQNIAAQVARTQATAIEVVKVRAGAGGLSMTIGLGHYLTVARDPVHARRSSASSSTARTSSSS